MKSRTERGKPLPTEQELLAALRNEANALRQERYPGDVMRDIAARLDGRVRGRTRARRWIQAAAVAASVAVIVASVVTRRAAQPGGVPSGFGRSSLAGVRPPTPRIAFLTPAAPPMDRVRAVLARRPARIVPARFAVPASGLSQALSIGTRALSSVRPPSRPAPIGVEPKEER